MGSIAGGRACVIESRDVACQRVQRLSKRVDQDMDFSTVQIRHGYTLSKLGE
jgi:hypothetical protein